MEKRVAAAEERIRELETLMGDPEHYKDGQQAASVDREYRDLRAEVKHLTGEWDRLTAEAERLKADFQRELDGLREA